MVTKKLIKTLKIYLSLIFWVLLIFTPNQQTLASPNSKIFVVATVNNKVITNLDIKKKYDFFVRTSHIKIFSESEKLFILNQLVQKLIEENLQSDEAQNFNIFVSDEELNQTLKEIATAQGASIDMVKAYFEQNQIPFEEYKNQIKNQILWKKIVTKTIAPKIQISESEINEMVELQKINIKKINLNLAEIFIPFESSKEEPASLSLAKKLTTEINNGGNFKDIARQFSRSTSSEFEGEIGWVEETGIDPKIYNAIKDIEIGKISNPIRTKDGYYIFKILDKKIVDNLPEKDIEQIKNFIFNKKLKILAKGYLNDLKKKSYIHIDQEKLKLI